MSVYVIDTSALIEDPGMINRISQPVIPGTVMGQLKFLRMNQNPEVAAKAEKALELIEKRKQETGDIRFVKSQKDAIGILASPADNKIVTAAIELKQAGKDPVLVTTDKYMKIVATAFGIETINPMQEKIGKKENEISWLPFIAIGLVILIIVCMCL